MRLAATLTVAILAGCGDPVGSGVGPSFLQISTTAATNSSGSAARVYLCFPIALVANMHFTDGSSVNFTKSVTWSSSASGIVRVSNGDIPGPEGIGFYPIGTLIPQSQGTATVTASFEGATETQIQVSVGVASAFSFRSDDYDLPMPITQLDVGTSTITPLKLYGSFDATDRDVTALTQWSVDAPGVGSIAQPSPSTVDAELTGLGPGESTDVTATFPSCGQSVHIPLTVQPIQGIEIDPEFGTAPLIVGNRERVKVMADLSDGTKQDITAQSLLVADQPDIATFSASLPYLLSALAPGTAVVSATFNSQFTAPEASVPTVAANLQSVAVTPTTATFVAGSGDIVPFTAVGTFDNGQTQDITNIVQWASADTNVAAIANTPPASGYAQSASTAFTALTGQVQITATAAAATQSAVGAATLDVTPPP